ncbi:hypothetical protein DL96DRAFT_1535093 [Flagelloscypha sp. PMI_526]|nr:hypothetical protein DL96DRAFT_1535093 [Flagelloscypha sp. PMI_526]
MSKTNKQTVVIIGSGSGGSLAHSLAPKLDASKHELILISPLPYYMLLIPALRMNITSEGNLDSTEKAMIPLDNLFPPGVPGRHIQGVVTSIEENTVSLEDGTAVDYDILVLATGSKWTGLLQFPFNNGEKAVQSYIEKQRAAIASAKDVIIAGGGSVGVELAGEIRHFYPKTKVTIVHSGNTPLNKAYPEKYRRAVKRRLEQGKVNVIYNDYIDDFPEAPVKTVRTRNGRELKADLVVSARGPTPDVSILKSSPFLSNTTTSENTVRISPTFQVQGHSNIFAIGDIIDWPEQKQIGKTAAHTSVTEYNILALLQGKDKESLKKYQGSKEMIAITFGPDGGITYLALPCWDAVFGDWFTRTLKSRGLTMGMARPRWGAKVY